MQHYEKTELLEQNQSGSEVQGDGLSGREFYAAPIAEGLPPLDEQLTSEVVQIQWSKYFPYENKAVGVTVHTTQYEEVYKFIEENHRWLSPDAASESHRRFIVEELNDIKKRYLSRVIDAFCFKNADGKTVGVYLGNLRDWSSYYDRYAGFLPEYQGKGLYSNHMRYLASILKEHRVSRIEAELSPDNTVSLMTHLRLSFKITGMALSDRWGFVLQLTQFLRSDCEQIYRRQFCQSNQVEFREGRNST